MTDYIEEVARVLCDADMPVHNPDVPVRETLDLDSLEMAELVLLLEERWHELEDRIDMDDPVWHTGTIRQIAARIEQTLEATEA